jgi:hypothetical protein
LSLSFPAIFQLLEKYNTTTQRSYQLDQPDRVVPDALKWPDGIGELSPSHIAYLRRRGLDPDEIVNLWHPLGTTGAAASLYANRIFAPLYFQGRVVSWQGRSIRDDCPDDFRYETCPKKDELVPCKSIVYGWDYVQEYKRGVVVEGLFDVWKLGPGAMHTFGISWCRSQAKLLAELDWIGIAFDAEPEAQRQARALAEEIAGLGKAVELIDWETEYKDAGETEVEVARQFMKDLGFAPINIESNG